MAGWSEEAKRRYLASLNNADTTETQSSDGHPSENEEVGVLQDESGAPGASLLDSLFDAELACECLAPIDPRYNATGRLLRAVRNCLFKSDTTPEGAARQAQAINKAATTIARLNGDASARTPDKREVFAETVRLHDRVRDVLARAREAERVRKVEVDLELIVVMAVDATYLTDRLPVLLPVVSSNGDLRRANWLADVRRTAPNFNPEMIVVECARAAKHPRPSALFDADAHARKRNKPGRV